MKTRPHHPIAFTLVELLVVVAIIVALLAMLLPSMGRALAVSQSAVCLSNTRQLFTAQSTFAADHFGSMFKHQSSPTATGNDPEHFWFGQAMRRLSTSDEKTMLCPTAPDLNLDPSLAYPGFGNATRSWGWPGQWSNYWISDFTGSYMFNCWMYDVSQSTWLPAGARGPLARYAQRLSLVVQPGNAPLFIDGAWCEGWPLHTDGFNGNFDDPYKPWLGIEMGRVTMMRHPGGTVNASFVDGSARSVTMPGLWTLKWHTQFDTTTGYKP